MRHLLATIKYRFDKSVYESNESFSKFNLGKGSRSPLEILTHMNDVLNFTRTFLNQERRTKVKDSKRKFAKELKIFQDELIIIDKALETIELTEDATKRIIQGPFSDLLTHIGQISFMRRLNDKPIERENFSIAPIKTGII